MGSQISGAYSNVNQIFTLDMWKVHTAVHKATNERVALWVLDQDRMQKLSKADRGAYFDLSSASIQKMRKLRHPRILKVLEIFEKKPELAFTSEPVSSSVASQTEKMHPMDAAYISLQLAEVLGFLNQDARMVHLGLSPSSVLLTDDFSVKLAGFQWSAALDTGNEAVMSPQLLAGNVLCELQFKPPEVLGKQRVTGNADVFVFGLFAYRVFTGESLNTAESAKDIISAMPTRVCSIFNVPVEFKALIQSCLSLDANMRPSFQHITQNQAFQSMQLKALRYIDMIVTKDAQDKFKFYRGLASKMDDFSPTLGRTKILPVLMSECQADVRFAPVLISAILQIGASMNNETFLRVIWKRMSFLTSVTKPPEVSISLVRSLLVLLGKIDKPLHTDYVYPIIVSALQSGDPRIHREVLTKIPDVAKQMSETTVRTMLLPRLLDVAGTSTDVASTAGALNCIAECSDKVDADTFAVDVIPRLHEVWKRAKNESVAEAIVCAIERVRAGYDLLMTRAIPLVADIAGSRALSPVTLNRMCDWMSDTIQKFKSDKTAKFGSAKQSDPDNPFGDSVPQSTQKHNEVSAAQRQRDAMAITSSDVFGSPTPKPVQVSASFTAADVFGSPTPPPAAKPTPPNPSFSAADVFGAPTPTPPSTSFSAADVFGAPTPTPTHQTIGGSYGQAPMGSTDVFGARPTQPANNAYASSPIDDIFGAPSSGMRGNTQAPTSGMNTFGGPGNSSDAPINMFGQGSAGSTAVFGARAVGQPPMQNTQWGGGFGQPQQFQQQPQQQGGNTGAGNSLLDLF